MKRIISLFFPKSPLALCLGHDEEPPLPAFLDETQSSDLS